MLIKVLLQMPLLLNNNNNNLLNNHNNNNLKKNKKIKIKITKNENDLEENSLKNFYILFFLSKTTFKNF